MNRMKSLVIAASLLPMVATSVAAQNREVRLLDANDVALPSVLFAAAKHVFDPNASQILGFGDVYVNKRRVPSLSADVRNYITRIGGFRQTSRPGDCEPSVDRPTAPRAPTSPGVTGGAPNPPSQPKRTTAEGVCNRGADITYTFAGVRIASDTAYVEMELAGVAKTSTKCLALTVDKEAGGWTPGGTKNSKVGQCGK
jgi:hypothetical protein